MVEHIVIMSEVQNAEPICPYCGFVFEVMLTRQRKCPKCKGTIYIRGTPPDNVKKLMSEAMLADNKTAWAAYHYERCKDAVENRRIKEEEEFEKALSTIQTSKNHHEKKIAYGHMALYYLRKGSEFRGGLIECQKGRCIEQLSEYLESGVNYVRIMSSPNTCQDLTIDHDEIHTIANALALMPIPHRGSDDGLCQCYYEEVFDDELPPGYVMPRPERIRLNHDYPASNSIDSEHEEQRLSAQAETIAPQLNATTYTDPVDKWFRTKSFIWFAFGSFLFVLLVAFLTSRFF